MAELAGGDAGSDTGTIVEIVTYGCQCACRARRERPPEPPDAQTGPQGRPELCSDAQSIPVKCRSGVGPAALSKCSVEMSAHLVLGSSRASAVL